MRDKPALFDKQDGLRFVLHLEREQKKVDPTQVHNR